LEEANKESKKKNRNNIEQEPKQEGIELVVDSVPITIAQELLKGKEKNVI
jgi:hypothetical protein